MKLALAGIVAGCVLATAAALAQPQPSSSSSPPQMEVKTIGDWKVRCFGVQNPNPCDQFWEQVDPRSGQRIVSVSIAYVPSMDRHLMQISVPLGVSIPKGLTIQTDSYTSPVMRYRMCSREGCFVQLAVDNALIESLAKSGSDAKVNIAADGGRVYALPLSLKGFSGAHDEMVSEAKAKAKPPAPGTTP